MLVLDRVQQLLAGRHQFVLVGLESLHECMGCQDAFGVRTILPSPSLFFTNIDNLLQGMYAMQRSAERTESPFGHLAACTNATPIDRGQYQLPGAFARHAEVKSFELGSNQAFRGAAIQPIILIILASTLRVNSGAACLASSMVLNPPALNPR